MLKAEFSRAVALAQGPMDLSNHDMSLLNGYGVPGFKKVLVTLEAVARCLRWQAFDWYKGWDSELLHNEWLAMRNTVDIIGRGAEDTQDMPTFLEPMLSKN
jgi:hypothetical protein